MTFNLKRIVVTIGAAALSLSTIACHGQSPSGSGYVPTASTALSAAQSSAGFAGPEARDKKVKIVSSCGKHVHIVILGIVDCKFREKVYGDGVFNLKNDTKGIVVINPSSGTRATTFTILGAVVGSGSFIVTDTKKHSLWVWVRVTL
jgi:hypothetical protein